MLHPKNKHKDGYNFKKLAELVPSLNNYVKPNKYGTTSIDFGNQKAVKALNKALLAQDYGIEHWDIPEGYLIPPIPGRMDYIHYLADLLGDREEIKVLDIGTGANCIYPLLAASAYGWQVVGTDIDTRSVKVAKSLVANNKNVADRIEIRLQNDPEAYFKNVVKAKERFDACICNPPFHASAEEANSVSVKKFNNLNFTKDKEANPNFQGTSNELWCKGGEERFIRHMIFESTHFSQQIEWFTCLVARKGHLRAIYKLLQRVNAKDFKTIEMAQGNKKSRFVSWRF